MKYFNLSFSKFFLLLILFLYINTKLYSAICQFCPNDNGGGGGSSVDCTSYGETIYVDISRPNDNGDGKSWANAKKYLHTALDIANYCDEIQRIEVAQGVYKPAITSTNRDLTFFVGNDITIQGGYPSGGNTNPNHVLYQTILSGVLATGIETYHIMVIYNQIGGVSVHGCIFQNGFADGTGSLQIGNSVYMARDDGAAVYIKDNTAVNFKNCLFYNNVANDHGGAVYSFASTTNFVNVIIANNTAGVNGGGLYLQTNSESNLTNCTFANNYYVSGGGGAIYNTTGSNINVYNTIIWSNTNSWNGGGQRNVWYSLIQDSNTHNGGSSTNNIYIDPEFVNSANIAGPDGDFFTIDDGLMVCTGSIIINRGLNTALNISNLDIKRDNRKFNEQVDIGPYENENYPKGYSAPAHGDSTVARVYLGKTSIPLEDCKVLSILTPDNAINYQFKTVVRHINSSFPTYNQYTKFVDRYYYLERIPIGDFNGKITLFFTNYDFVQFNDDPYSLNNLPIASNQIKNHLRIIKFPGVSSTYLPDSYTAEPEIIDPADADISYSLTTLIWTVTFENTGSLGTYFVTTKYDYILNGTDFSNPNNWNNNIKPNAVLPSLNRIFVTYPYHCTINEAFELKPFSKFDFITPI